jgi:hypothetical protein
MVTISDYSKRLNSDGEEDACALPSELLRTAELQIQLSGWLYCMLPAGIFYG